MRVIALKKLRDIWTDHADAEMALRAWYTDARQSVWLSPEDIKRIYRTASFVGGDRVVFNIRGNTYRLIVMVNYETQIVYVRFVGTHAEYDKVNAEVI